ncbi:MAG: 3-phosphoshikimate 1-carboxyvinyltransferase [Bacteroidetes bacterium]|nr:3-phosphoshikimate 1-carboxyvinyltransferase [Bacteroidota bacterium]
MKTITIDIDRKKISGCIRLPASKSISNRALIIQFLKNSEIPILNLSPADDTILMQSLLHKVRNYVEREKACVLDCQNAGTVLRFLTAVLSITSGEWIVTGTSRMKERPVAILVESLQQLGAQIEYIGVDGYPPLRIKGRSLKGGEVSLDSSVSSQYVSALMMIGPLLENGLILNLKNRISSRPYIEMTMNLMRYFGVNSSFQSSQIVVPNQPYLTRSLTIEPDWSAASFWYEIAAFAEESEIILEQLGPESIQGDSILPEIFHHFGIRTEFNQNGIHLFKEKPSVSTFAFDFTNHPDLAMPVIVTCSGLGIEGRFTGLRSLRFKESDRIAALQSELERLGFHNELTDNELLRITTSEKKKSSNSAPLNISEIPQTIHTYSDHRMAMSFAPLALLTNTLRIENPDVVSKSYPNFWKDLIDAGFMCKF